jgi:hypothetical protein
MQQDGSAEELRARLQNIDPYEFEDFVAELWKRRGWDVSVSQDSQDMGVDVVAEKSGGLVGQKQVIQAKRYSQGNTVGRPDIQQYHSLKSQVDGADAVVVVTTSSFTSTAEEWANEHNVKLIDGDDLVELLIENSEQALLDEYAPTLSSDSSTSIDPASEVAQEPEVNLPDFLEDSNTRVRYGGVGAIAGVALFFAPGVSDAVAGAGVLLAVLALALTVAPRQVVGLVAPERMQYKKFSNGGTVVKHGDEIRYEPGDGRDVRTFDAFEDKSRCRQQAVIYGTLDNRFGSNLTETEQGVLPTEVASEGDQLQVVYRFAVHDESPEQIADDMNTPQKEVVGYIEDFDR